MSVSRTTIGTSPCFTTEDRTTLSVPRTPDLIMSFDLSTPFYRFCMSNGMVHFTKDSRETIFPLLVKIV